MRKQKRGGCASAGEVEWNVESPKMRFLRGMVIPPLVALIKEFVGAGERRTSEKGF